MKQFIRALLDSPEYGASASLSRNATAEDYLAAHQSTDPNLITPAEVISQCTIEELAATAEEYYARETDPTPLLVKPFAFTHEAPEMLQNLGRLLAGLQLGKTMTVLDFGGGTGWLSRFLAQLNCQPICCDVSHTALTLGEWLIELLPLIGTTPYRPQFLHFDGHRIELPDESVDRIICFDSFHHVPNPQEVLSEFYRLLKTGGIVGFSEPGMFHSRSSQSQYEMRNHKVLENDIDLVQMEHCSRIAGFTSMRIKVFSDQEVDLEGHQSILRYPTEAFKSDLVDVARQTAIRQSIFFLGKGTERLDSRQHTGLAHELHADTSRLAADVGQPVRLSISLRNIGTATWLSTNDQIFGIVRIGTHLQTETGRLINIDFSRHSLPRDISPGEQAIVPIDLVFPVAGRYRLTLDLVAEGVTWFENQGSKPEVVNVQVSAVGSPSKGEAWGR